MSFSLVYGSKEISFCSQLGRDSFRGIPIVFMKLKDNKIFSVFSQTKQYFFLFKTLTVEINICTTFHNLTS